MPACTRRAPRTHAAERDVWTLAAAVPRVHWNAAPSGIAWQAMNATVPWTAQVAAFERRIRWRAVSLVVFLAMMVGLAVTATVSLLPPRSLAGLPNDPAVRAAATMVRGLSVPTGGLRFGSELTGASDGRAATAADVQRAARAAALLAGCRARHDPRVLSALGALDLAQRRYVPAERHYREAIDRTGHLGEARLGLGVALALEAATTSDPLQARGLMLQAIAQLYAVRDDDSLAPVALWDRAVLQDAVGRHAGAVADARAYLLRESTGPWADAMRKIAGT